MNTDVLSIAGALRKHAGPVALIVVELAVLMAVLCNTLFLVSDYARVLALPTGIDDRDVAAVQWVGVVGSSAQGSGFSDTIHRLKSIPGVVAAAWGNVPFWVDRLPIFVSRGQQLPTVSAFEFGGSQGLDRVLGLQLVAGHLPADSELPDVSNFRPSLQTPVLITQALAQRLFPGERHVLGKVIYVTDALAGVIPVRVIGIISHLRGALTGTPEDDYSYLLEGRWTNQDIGGLYVFRSRPGEMPAVLRAAQSALAQMSQDHVVSRAATVETRKEAQLADTRSNVWTLAIVLAILSLIAVCGLIAVTSFWVQRRRIQIGVRRALGATRGNIIHYFQLENALIVAVGVCLGSLLALALNTLLVQLYAIPRLPLPYLLIAAAMLLCFGQLAALFPALRAAAIPPSTAFRATY